MFSTPSLKYFFPLIFRWILIPSGLNWSQLGVVHIPTSLRLLLVRGDRTIKVGLEEVWRGKLFGFLWDHIPWHLPVPPRGLMGMLSRWGPVWAYRNSTGEAIWEGRAAPSVIFWDLIIGNVCSPPGMAALIPIRSSREINSWMVHCIKGGWQNEPSKFTLGPLM